MELNQETVQVLATRVSPRLIAANHKMHHQLDILWRHIQLLDCGLCRCQLVRHAVDGHHLHVAIRDDGHPKLANQVADRRWIGIFEVDKLRRALRHRWLRLLLS